MTKRPGLVDPTGHVIEPYGNGMETAGRFAVNDTAGALDLMRRTWGRMVDPNDPLYTAAPDSRRRVHVIVLPR